MASTYKNESISTKPREGSEFYEKLLTGYWSCNEHFFARGWAGLVYTAWLVAITVIALLQVLNVIQFNFVVNIVLTSIEGGVVLIGVILLGLFSYMSDKTLKRLRRHHDQVLMLGGHHLENIIKSRANVLSDWNLFSRGLVWILAEITLMAVLATGVKNDTVGTIVYLSGSQPTDFNVPNTPVSVADLVTSVIRLVYFAFVLIKGVSLLGQSLDRTVAVGLGEKLSKLYSQLEHNGGHHSDVMHPVRFTSKAEEMVALASTPSTFISV